MGEGGRRGRAHPYFGLNLDFVYVKLVLNVKL